MYGLLFTLPDANTLLSGIGSTSEPVFTDFLPLVYLAVGIIFGLFVVYFIIKAISNALHHPGNGN